MRELVEFIAKSLVENKDAVEVSIEEEGRNKVLNVRVDDSEIGKLIGKQGKIANSIRTLLRAASSDEERFVLNIGNLN